MKILGIIPARSGSKGIPGKNSKLLQGHPLIHYTAASAAKSALLSTCIVSTDSQAIAASVQSFGIQAPFIRPPALALDSTPSIDVVVHALNYFESNNIFFDAICLLQPTSPFRLPGFIDDCIKKFIDTNADTLFSTQPVPHTYHPNWVFKKTEHDFLVHACGNEEMIAQRQLLPEAYIRDGSIYIVKTTCVQGRKTFYGNKMTHLPSPPQWYVNIDTPHDWERAELIAKAYIDQVGI